MGTTAGNVRIQTVQARWEVEEAFCVDFKNSTAAALAGTYFTFSDDLVDYYVWFDTGADTDPAPASKTGIEADVSAATTPALIAAAVETAVEAATGYEGVLTGLVLRFDLDNTEAVSDDAADFDSGLAISQVIKGGNLDLGLISGDVVPALEETLLDITAHQTGTTILAQLRQGLGVSLPLALQDYTKDMYQQLITAAGGVFTPAAGTELYGRGQAALGGNTITKSRRLILHPFNKLAADKSEDITVWLAYPAVDNITFSGENPQIMNVTFTAFLDDRRPAAINLLAFGDSSQAGILA